MRAPVPPLQIALRYLVLLALPLLPAWPAARGQEAAGAAAEGAAYRVVVFGDFNGPYGTVGYGAAVGRVVRQITEVWRPDLVLLPGDVVAGQDRGLEAGRFAEMWAAFEEEVAAPLHAAGIPYALAVGNHDASSLRAPDGSFVYERERAAAAAHLRAHDPGLEFQDAAGYPFDYSFTAGPLFVVVWDASSATVTAAQREWLLRELASPAARAARERIVMGHLPLVGVAEGRARPGEVLAGAAELREFLARHGADTYVSGHQAAYYPGRSDGLELLMSGGVGARRLLGGGPPRSAVTVIGYPAGRGEVRYESFDPATLEQLDAAELPPLIEGYGGNVRLSPRGAP